MIYELREYTAAPGAIEALHRRFDEHVLALFRKHGLDVRGFWVAADDPDTVVYLLAFPDVETHDRAWERFQADPEWHDVKATTEADGPLTVAKSGRLLAPVAYWTDAPPA